MCIVGGCAPAPESPATDTSPLVATIARSPGRLLRLALSVGGSSLITRSFDSSARILTLGSWTSMRPIWIAWTPLLVWALPFSQVMPGARRTSEFRT